MYRRYVDDTFVLFSNEAHAFQFLDYLNSRHANMKFTIELEKDKKLPFLDMLAERGNDRLYSSIYRKPTFSGLGISFFSYCSHKFKINAIKTLLYRAYHLSSTYKLFHNEIEFLKKFFKSNGFNSNLFNSQVRKFINNKFQPPVRIPTANKEKMYISLPHLGDLSEKMISALTASLSNFYPQIDFRFVNSNNFRIGSFFKVKDQLPKALVSSLVYKFTCPNCRIGYIGSSFRNFKTRMDEHIGQSSRTGRPLSQPPQSVVREHSETCKFKLGCDHFSIVDSCKNIDSLRILESLYIKKVKTEAKQHSFRPSSVQSIIIFVFISFLCLCFILLTF